jgi:hypothetical protein
MVDSAIVWGLHNPLQCVAVLCVVAIVVGLVFVPRLRDVCDHGHPRV